MIYLFWGLNRNGSKDLLAAFRNQPTFRETDVFAQRYPHYDFLLGALTLIENELNEGESNAA